MNVTITSPNPNEVVSGLVLITGSTIVPDFQFYRIDISAASADLFGPTGEDIKQSVAANELYKWDSTQMPNGPYTLRLRAFDSVFQYCEAFVTIEINNVIPTATVTGRNSQTTISPNNANINDNGLAGLYPTNLSLPSNLQVPALCLLAIIAIGILSFFGKQRSDGNSDLYDGPVRSEKEKDAWNRGYLDGMLGNDFPPSGLSEKEVGEWRSGHYLGEMEKAKK